MIFQYLLYSPHSNSFVAADSLDVLSFALHNRVISLFSLLRCSLYSCSIVCAFNSSSLARSSDFLVFSVYSLNRFSRLIFRDRSSSTIFSYSSRIPFSAFSKSCIYLASILCYRFIYSVLTINQSFSFSNCFTLFYNSFIKLFCSSACLFFASLSYAIYC